MNRLELNNSLDKVFEIIEQSGFIILPITPDHVLKMTKLDFHHRDPFDRLLIGQALSEGLKIMSKDAQFKHYQAELIWEK